jgi:CPA1 family monovalent cation:H+ antiporter
MGLLDLITLLIFLAAVFTLVNITILKLPSTIGLMAIALMMSIAILILGYFFPSLIDGAQHIVESFDFEVALLGIMLNFLLFAGALFTNVSAMLKEKVPIIILAVASTIISTFIVGYIMFYAFQLVGYPLDLIYCLLFGALISPTDPIAVLSLTKKFGLSQSLEIKIAGESLFNDGVGVVIFLTLLGIAKKGMANFDIVEVGMLFGQEVIGGLLFGALLGYLGHKLLDHIDNDHVELEVLVTISLVFLGGRISELMHVSAPLAMVVMGLMIGNQGMGEKLTNATGVYVFKFWHLLDESLNAILFILIGLEMLVIAQEFEWSYLVIGGIAIVVVLFARLIGVGIPIVIMKRFREFEEKTIQILVWGGLRGGISVALSLSLPTDMPGKSIIVTATYCVVVFSILVQGMTIEKLLKK